MNLAFFMLRRVLLLGPMLVGITLLTFILSHAVPADPVTANLGDAASANPAIVAAFKHEWGLDKPLYEQYGIYLWRLLHGNLGVSISTRQPVVTDLHQRLPATVELAVAAVLLSTAIGVPAGIVAAVRRDHAPDIAVRVVSITGISFPVFWLGILLQLVFFYYAGQMGLPTLPSRGRVGDLVALEYPLVPVTGFYLIDSLLRGNLPFFLDALRHLVLPALTLSLIGLATVVRIMRASMLEVLRQDYILLARSKGLPLRTVLLRHALRNAITPVLTTAGPTLGILLGGAVVVETVFSWPGIGRLAAQGILNNDVVLVVGFTLFVATMMVLVNLAVDILYAVIDPRVRY